MHVQGSAKIRMPDGQIEAVGYAAHNGWEYKSIRYKMVADGKFTEKNINMKTMIDYFMVHPDEVDIYINENPHLFSSGLETRRSPRFTQRAGNSIENDCNG